LLTLLRVIRRRCQAAGGSLKVHPVTLRVHDVAELMALTAGASRGVALRRARSGIRAAELLRRLGLQFSGDVSQGRLEVSEAALLRWLRPAAVQAPLGSAATPFAPKSRGLPGSSLRLPEELRESTRRLRSLDL